VDERAGNKQNISDTDIPVRYTITESKVISKLEWSVCMVEICVEFIT